ncbi:MAG TPA: hypothetical protein ENN06_03645 [Desulfobacteraceae bacterium]|nr:hypothetical protein [Desulfobacteraceae bacterium]
MWKLITVVCAIISALSVIGGFFILIFRQGKFFGKLTEHVAGQDKKIEKNCTGLTNLSTNFYNFKTEFERGRYMTESQHAPLCERNTRILTDKMNEVKSAADKDIDEIKDILTAGERRRDESRKEDAVYREKTFTLLSEIKTSVDVIAANHNNLADRVDKLEDARA